MNQPPHEDVDPILIEAADWFAKTRGPEAARWAPELAAWRQQRPENDAAYLRLLQNWERSAFLAHSPIARGRDLRSVAIWSRRPPARIAAIAASLLLVVGLGTLMARGLGWYRTAAPSVSVASADRVVRTIVLGQGARATLDADSAIEVRSDTGAQRIKLVRGRIRFETGPGARAFAVDANGGTIEGRNAAFDVSLSGKAVKVVLWRGTLRVAGSVRRANWPNRLMAGQQLVFDPARGSTFVQPADPGDLGWTRGMLSFERTPLVNAVAALNRYNLTQIRLSPQLYNLRVTGAFHAHDPQGFARALSGMFGFSLVRGVDGTIELAPGIKA